MIQCVPVAVHFIGVKEIRRGTPDVFLADFRVQMQRDCHGHYLLNREQPVGVIPHVLDRVAGQSSRLRQWQDVHLFTFHQIYRHLIKAFLNDCLILFLFHNGGPAFPSFLRDRARSVFLLIMKVLPSPAAPFPHDSVKDTDQRVLVDFLKGKTALVHVVPGILRQVPETKLVDTDEFGIVQAVMPFHINIQTGIKDFSEFRIPDILPDAIDLINRIGLICRQLRPIRLNKI